MLRIRVIILIFCCACSAVPQKIFINEFLASNVTINADIVDFDDYSDWLELYNAEDFEVDLSGYFLTDDLRDSSKWQIPEGIRLGAKSCLLIWADGYDEGPGSLHMRDVEPFDAYQTQSCHTNFKLSKGGEQLALFTPGLTLVDSIVFGLQISDVSYGRQPDGGLLWQFFGEPTPGKSNQTPGTSGTDAASVPIFSLPSGVYPSGQILTLSAASSDYVIRYTTNGDRPGSQSEIVQGPIDIDESMVLRARVFEADKLPGPMVTHSYFIGEAQTLPILSVSVFPASLWGYRTGIYANSIKGREIPVTLEFFEKDGTSGFKHTAGFRISGQGAYQYPQKPFTISMRDRFGADFIQYPVFPEIGIQNYKSIYLRNSGTPDNRHTLFRDALQHVLVMGRMDLDVQAYRPVVTFINGAYWGIYNIREKLNADYLAMHHPIDPTNIDYLETDFSRIPVVIEGSADDYQALLGFIQDNDLSISRNYETVRAEIDIDSFIDYLITEIYCDNINWLNTNVRWWRERTEGARWRWILVDMDWGFGTEFPNFSSLYSNNTLDMATSALGSSMEHEKWATLLIRSLLENESFRGDFIQRFASHLNTTFKKERVLQVFDSLKAQIEPEMPRHIDRWNDHQEQTFNDLPIQNMGEWQDKVSVMREFAEKRTEHLFSHLNSFFELYGMVAFGAAVSDPEHGHITINQVAIPDSFEGQFFKSVPVFIKAIPEAGFRFLHWEGASSGTEDSISLKLYIDSSISAIFELDDNSRLPERIAGQKILTQDRSPYIASGDVTIDSTGVLIVFPGVEIQMPEESSIFVSGQLRMLGSAENPIQINPHAESGSEHWGAICIEQAADTAVLEHVQLRGATRGTDKIRQVGAISAHASHVRLEHVRILDAPFPVFLEEGSLFARACTLFSDQSCDLINVKNASYALIESCDFRGNESFDTDAIDLDGVQSALIRENRIYNFYGPNSDGIDLGEACSDVLIENNLIFNCRDKGVSVGQASTTDIILNVIVNCGQGVGVKDENSYAAINHNTFYGNDYAVASFEKNIGSGGGRVDVINCILARSETASLLVDALSVLNVTFSLSDTDSLSGTGNLMEQVHFANNFYLTQNSPAVDSGDPSGKLDSDGSRADMGAFAYDAQKVNFLQINEIHYNPAGGRQLEFVEIINNGPTNTDISAYYFDEGIHFVFPHGTEIGSGEIFLLAKEKSAYEALDSKVFQWSGDGLPHVGGNIRLVNPQGSVIDLVSYDRRHGWAGSANGAGPSLVLRNPELENLYVANWRASLEYGGSPGRPNEASAAEYLVINEFCAINQSIIEDEDGDTEDWIEIYNGGDTAVDIGGFYLTDDLSRPMQFQIPTTNPDSTTIGPGEMLLLWADEDPEQGILHIDFQLTGGGEQIGLFRSENGIPVLIDQVVFETQSSDQSTGRNPDGGPDWQIFRIPTPAAPNTRIDLFGKGILLVNGVSYIYGEEILNAYENRAFWGDNPIAFWDCFEAPQDGYPATLPIPLGYGPIPMDTLKQYGTVVWIGNSYQGDLDIWKLAAIHDYLHAGGNLILLTRLGQRFIDLDLADRTGIIWEEATADTLRNCEANYEGLTDIRFVHTQSLYAVFDTELKKPESTLLFSETASFSEPKGLGLWHQPELGGAYREKGGQFIFLSGRPYRYHREDLRKNVEVFLDFLSILPDTSRPDTTQTLVLTKFRLGQNYPNPFNPETTIEFDMPREGWVDLFIFNVQGHLVKRLSRKQLFGPGRHRIEWDGRNEKGNQVGSGAYLYRISTPGYSKTRKMVLLR